MRRFNKTDLRTFFKSFREINNLGSHEQLCFDIFMKVVPGRKKLSVTQLEEILDSMDFSDWQYGFGRLRVGVNRFLNFNPEGENCKREMYKKCKKLISKFLHFIDDFN